jgi:hypothetical protein
MADDVVECACSGEDKSVAADGERPKSTLFPHISGKVRDLDENIARCVLEPAQRDLEPAARIIEPPGRLFQFTGTVKLHGAHVDIVVHHDGHVVCQSRGVKDLTPGNDPLGFATFISTRKAGVSSFAAKLKARWLDLHSGAEIGAEPMIIAGEWVGEKIQRGKQSYVTQDKLVLTTL